MGHTRQTMGQVLVSAVAVGALSLGGAGLAAAASPAQPAVSVTAPGTAKLSAFDCSNAGRALTRIDKAEAGSPPDFPGCRRPRTRPSRPATAGGPEDPAGDQPLEGSKVKNRLARRAAAIEASAASPLGRDESPGALRARPGSIGPGRRLGKE